MRRLLLSLLVLSAFSGCVTSPAVTAFKVYGSYTIALREAATIRETPGIPKEVILRLQQAATIASPIMETMAEAAIAYDEADTRIKAMEAQGLPAIPKDLDTVRIAGEQIAGFLAKVQPAVEELVKAVNAALR